MIIHTGRPGRLYAIGLVLYVIVLVAGITLLAGDGRRPSAPVGVGVALLSAVAAVLMLIDGPLRMGRQEGIERLVLRQSTSIAFFVSMAVAVTLGLLEVFTDMAPASPWVLWIVGMSTWAVSSTFLHRRMG
jgi:hypothetical protein